MPPEAHRDRCLRELAEACARDIIELHHFLESWLRGDVPRTPAVLDRLGQSLAAPFTVIYPSGVIDDRATVLRNFWDAHASRPDTFRIVIRDLHALHVASPWCLLTYQEWLHEPVLDGRIASALLRAGTDGRVVWHHLHETRLDARHFSQRDRIAQTADCVP